MGAYILIFLLLLLGVYLTLGASILAGPSPISPMKAEINIIESPGKVENSFFAAIINTRLHHP